MYKQQAVSVLSFRHFMISCLKKYSVAHCHHDLPIASFLATGIFIHGT
jgi:hypothetical protein